MSTSGGKWVFYENSLRSLRNAVGKLEPTPKRKNRDTKPKRRKRKPRRPR